jgi:DNA repair protein RadC
MLNLNPASLSDTELLAIILRTGGAGNSALSLASEIIGEYKGFKGILNADINELISHKNLGVVKTCCIKAACEIGLRLSSQVEDPKIYVGKPADIFSYVRKEFLGKLNEHLFIICLDAKNRIISKDLLTVGTINETLIHPREVFKKALIRNASSIILVHNHPSGDTYPSKEDINVTQRILKISLTMGIALMDHIIVSDKSFTSLKALNYMKGGE